MRLDVNKLQQGGIFQIYQPLQFETRQPAVRETAGSSGSSSSSSSTKKKEEDGNTLLTKQVMNELIKNGLPNEVDHFLTKLHELERSPLSSELTRSQTIALAKEANRIIHNRKQWQAAITQAEENEAISDYAVTDNGSIYVYDHEKQRIRTISAKEYAENMGEEGETLAGLESKKNIYQPLTVGQLAEYRASLPQTAFEDNSIYTIRQSIGISKISKSIWDVVKTLGDSTSSQEDYKTVAQMLDETGMTYHAPSTEALEGLKEIARTYSEMGVDAVFKFTEKNKSPNIQAAMKYLYSMLPKNAINQLRSKAIIEGNELYTPEQLITNALGAGIKTEHSLKTDIATIKDPNASGSSGSSGKPKTDNLTTMQMLVSGDLGRSQYDLISLSNPDKSLQFQGSVGGALANVRNNIEVGEGIFLERLKNAEMLQLIDQTNIYAGGVQKLTVQDLNNFIYEGGEVRRISVPVRDGVPDFETATKVNALMDLFKQKPNEFPTDREKTMALQSYGIPGVFENGVYVGGDNTAEYFVITGLTTDKVVDPSDNIYGKKVDKEYQDQFENYMERVYALHNKGKKGDQKLDAPISWLSNMVHVPIFLKVHTNANNTVLTAANSGPQVTVPTYQEAMAREQFQAPSYNQQQQIIQGASTSLLFPSSN